MTWTQRLELLDPPAGSRRSAPGVPAAGFLLAGLPRPARPGRLPGRRHGSRQDRAAARAAAAPADRPGAADLPAVGARATGSARRPGSRPRCGCGCCTAPTGPSRPRLLDGCDVRADHLRDRHPRRRRAGRHRRGTGWCSTRRSTSRTAPATVARAVRRIPARTRIALTGTPVENRLAELWSILDFLNPGLLASAHTFRARFSVPIERYADEEAAARLRHATRPFLLRRVKTDPAVIDDLPDKRHLRHLCGLTGEQATPLPRGARRDAATAERGHRPAAQGHRAGRDDQAQTGLQPPGPAARRRLAAARPLRQAGTPRGDPGQRAGRAGSGRCASPSSPGSARCWRRTWPPGSACRCATCTAAPRAAPATRMVAEFQADDAARHLRAVAEGRRHRPQPDRGQPRRARRPLVEPGHRGAGHRPGVPDRPGPRRAGAHAALPRHPGGAHRPPARRQGRAAPNGWSATARAG